MRFDLALIGLFATTALLTGQTREAIASAYGAPDPSGYIVGKDVQLTAVFGSDGKACRINVRARQPQVISDPRTPALFPAFLADRVVDKWVPAPARAGTPRIVFEQFSCSARRVEEYEAVRVLRLTNECAPVNQPNMVTLTIEWSRSACALR